jgi:hypothetical protein
MVFLLCYHMAIWIQIIAWHGALTKFSYPLTTIDLVNDQLQVQDNCWFVINNIQCKVYVHIWISN